MNFCCSPTLIKVSEQQKYKYIILKLLIEITIVDFCPLKYVYISRVTCPDPLSLHCWLRQCWYCTNGFPIYRHVPFKLAALFDFTIKQSVFELST